MQAVVLIFAILTVAGAWAAWRRSPIYSPKTTLKLAGALLLTVGAIVGGAIAIVSGPITNSPTAQTVLIGVLVIGAGIGATAGIVRITDGHVAQLPAPVRIGTWQRHRIQRWIWRVVTYLLISGAAMFVVPPMWTWLPGVPAVLVLLGGGPSLVALYMRARRLDLGMSQVLAAPWAYWQYTPEQWQAWARNQLEWERSQEGNPIWKLEWRKMLKGAVLPALTFAGCAWLAVSGSVSEKLTAAGLGIAILFTTILCLRWANRNASERRYRRLLAAPREVVFGDEGLYYSGEFSPWMLSGSYLVEATAPRDPPTRLVFAFQTYNGSSSTVEVRRIPIPSGRESDVPTIQENLRARCPKATVRLA